MPRRKTQKHFQSPGVIQADGGSPISVNGINYRVSNHGRYRYLQRAGIGQGDCRLSDSDIVRSCINDPRAVWGLGRPDGYLLITYPPKPSKNMSHRVNRPAI